MNRLCVIVAAGLAFSLAGCVLKPAPKAVASTPVAPKPVPAAPAPPAPPPEPLSIPQTHVDLPAPQPLSPEALAAAQLPEETVSPAPVNYRKNRGKPLPSAASARPEPPRTEPAARPEPVKPEPAAPAAPAPQIRPIVPPEEEQQYKQKADEIRRETLQRITNLHGPTLDRIQSFLRQSQEAEKHGEMRQAYEFADKALGLAKGMTGGK